MKGKLLITAMLGTLVASNASATIARQVVFGNQPIFTSAGTSGVVSAPVNGSLWYDDDYNVFYNPSYVMDNKNYVVVQKGLEGGFFKGLGENFAYGVYMNRGGAGNAGAAYGAGLFQAPGVNQNAAFSGTPAIAAGDFNTQRPIDLFIAGDTGIKWGLHVAWAYNRDQSVATATRQDAELTNRYWHFDLGAQVMGLEPFVGATMFSKYQDNSTPTTTTQDLHEFNVGTRYKYEGWSPYVVFKKHRELGNNTNVVARRGQQAQARMNTLGVGVGHDTKVADGVHVFKHIAYFRNSVEDDTSATEQNRDYYEQVVPINVALEADATSWLTLRGGVTYNLINVRKHARLTAAPTPGATDREVSQAGNLAFRIGPTFKFGKLHVDAAFGNDTGANSGVDNTSMGFDSNTFAFVSASYHW